jgi:hypothetical protein
VEDLAAYGQARLELGRVGDCHLDEDEVLLLRHVVVGADLLDLLAVLGLVAAVGLVRAVPRSGWPGR